MKKYLTFLSCAALWAFGACKSGNNNAVDKDALKGKYEVDLSSAEDILSEELQKHGNLSAYMFLLSQLECRLPMGGFTCQPEYVLCHTFTRY